MLEHDGTRRFQILEKHRAIEPGTAGVERKDALVQAKMRRRITRHQGVGNARPSNNRANGLKSLPKINRFSQVGRIKTHQWKIRHVTQRGGEPSLSETSSAISFVHQQHADPCNLRSIADHRVAYSHFLLIRPNLHA